MVGLALVTGLEDPGLSGMPFAVVHCIAAIPTAVSSCQCITPRMILSGHDRRGVACGAMP